MATKKTTKKNTKKPATKTAGKKAKASSAKKSKSTADNQLSVRMYRIGFGDFFLITVPTKTGPHHILIDCGVHKGDIKSMGACVDDLATTTKKKLALVIATHYHSDHLSGFASNFDKFAEFEVGMVWLPNRLDPSQEEAMKFKAQIRSLANQLQMRLGARNDDDAIQALFKVEDALGIQLGVGDREGTNEKALRLLTTGFKNKPPVRYYQAGDEAEFPKELKGAITVELLGPAPIDSGGEFSTPENKKEQYLAAVADEGLPDSDTLEPFEKDWPATAAHYSAGAFREYRTLEQINSRTPGDPKALEKILEDAQPDTLFAMAEAIDGTLNNQSLVTLFTCKGKKLLFVGDAQWGNWSYWLYGRKVTGANPGITDRASEILGSIDFYKVGHHGSTNANPIPAVAALNPECVSMCSTESADAIPGKKRPHGSIENKSEVPRIDLMVEMGKRTKNRLVRSDWIDVLDAKASPEARSQLAKLPKNFTPGPLYIDYTFKD